MKIYLKARHIKGLLILLVMSGTTWLSFGGLDGFWKNNTSQGTEAVKEALLKASIQCYALEGAYPTDVNYLKSHYGIQLNETAYYYYYEYLGANIRPNIEVVRKWDN